MSTNGSIEERVREYLASGGLFNPELMDHEAVRDLLESCLSVLSAKNSRIAELEAGLEEASGTLDWAARRMKGNCAGSDVSAVMLSAARAHALLNGGRKG